MSIEKGVYGYNLFGECKFFGQVSLLRPDF